EVLLVGPRLPCPCDWWREQLVFKPRSRSTLSFRTKARKPGGPQVIIVAHLAPFSKSLMSRPMLVSYEARYLLPRPLPSYQLASGIPTTTCDNIAECENTLGPINDKLSAMAQALMCAVTA